MKRTKSSKKKLLLSFSGGETSAYMTQWCLANWQDKYDMEVVFANTGEEHEETLEFIKKCDEILGFDTTWVETDVRIGKIINGRKHNLGIWEWRRIERKLRSQGITDYSYKTFGISSKYEVVNFETAHRDGEPFRDIIEKYGIPNPNFPHCTRELKTNPIKSYIKNEVGWDDFYTAIGIRNDEIDRMSKNAEVKKYIYPLIQNHPMTKKNINKYWSEMPFRLQLKGYQGNCKACWKKSKRKLYQISLEEPKAFDNMKQWEEKYENYIPPGRNHGDDLLPFRFYRGNTSVKEIKKQAREKDFIPPKDDSKPVTQSRAKSIFENDFDEELDVGGGCEESCEPFS